MILSGISVQICFGVRVLIKFRAAPFLIETRSGIPKASVNWLIVVVTEIGTALMGKSLSMDLRAQALSAVDGGMSRRAAAQHFAVSISSLICWDAARQLTGSYSPRKQDATPAHANWNPIMR